MRTRIRESSGRQQGRHAETQETGGSTSVELASCRARLRAGRMGRKEADRMHRKIWWDAKRRQATIFGKPRKCVSSRRGGSGLLRICTDAGCARVGSWLIHTEHGTASCRLIRIEPTIEVGAPNQIWSREVPVTESWVRNNTGTQGLGAHGPSWSSGDGGSCTTCRK